MQTSLSHSVQGSQRQRTGLGKGPEHKWHKVGPREGLQLLKESKPASLNKARNLNETKLIRQGWW